MTVLQIGKPVLGSTQVFQRSQWAFAVKRDGLHPEVDALVQAFRITDLKLSKASRPRMKDKLRIRLKSIESELNAKAMETGVLHPDIPQRSELLQMFGLSDKTVFSVHVDTGTLHVSTPVKVFKE
jgi:hypothetical protein